MPNNTVHYRSCHLCEAICGVKIEVNDSGEIISIKGDKEDAFSQGYICPKATALQDLHEDKNRLRKPVKRVGAQWKEIEWNEAIDLVAAKLAKIIQRDGGGAVGKYAGNPSVHNWGLLTHAGNLFGLIKGNRHFSATSVDQLPHHLCSFKMFGHQLLTPIPDIDRTELFIIFGGNPMASNGSLMTVPNIRGRLKSLQDRGGELVVFDPRKTETANIATQHHFIKPGSDALVLLAMLHTVFEEGLERVEAYAEFIQGLDEVKQAVAEFSPERVAEKTGVSASVIRDTARKLANTEKSSLYGRMGVSAQRFGTLSQWAINVLNIVCGNLDREGGMMFTKPAMDTCGPNTKRGSFNRFQSRVSAYPEFGGELPVACLAEEISTPGEGQLKALITVAGNPVLSTPNGTQLEAALDQLEFMVAIDFYVNETTRKADVILPPTSPLEHDHYDIAFFAFSVRNVTRYNPPVFEKPADARHDWELLTELGKALAAKLGIENNKPEMQPTDLLDFALATGPYGNDSDHPEAPLSVKKLKQHPHGIDLGPLQACLPERLQGSKQLECFPDIIETGLKGLVSALNQPNSDELVLIGRRHIRSNNSWLHNSRRLMKGNPRHQLLMHPDDLKARNLADGAAVKVSSRVGHIEVEVNSSEEIMPGVASLPHGFGHRRTGVKLDIAQEYPGVSANDLTDEKFLDTISGNAALNGVPITVTAV